MASFRKRYGKWEFRITYFDPIERKYKEKMRGNFKNKVEAKKAASELEYNIELNMEELSLEHWLETYIDHYREGKVATNTLTSNKNSVRIILAYFQKIRLKEITPELYQSFLNDMQKQGYSTNSIRSVHGTFRKAMERAVLNQRLNTNPSLNVQLPSGSSQRDSMKYLPADKIVPFLDNVWTYNPHTYYYFKALLDTGMRKGEAAALTWEDINMDDQTIHINKSFDVNKQLLGTTKTKKSRTIYYGPTLQHDLEAIAKEQKIRKVKYGHYYRKDLNLVFAREYGDYQARGATFRAMKKACQEVGVDDLPIHALRHTHAVLQLEAGISMKALQERLGHASMSTTANIYSHITSKIEKENVDLYESRIQQVYQPSSSAQH